MTEVPANVKKALHKKNIVPEEEEIIFHERQNRWANLLFPAHIVLTENQVIQYKPSLIGHSTETRPVGRVNDIDVETGLLFDTVSIQSRELDNFSIGGLPKNEGNTLRNKIHQIKEE
jgi:hypothetical protein